MAQLELSLSSKIQKDTQRSEVLIRLFQGSKLNLRGKSGVFVTPNHFEYYQDEAKTRKEGYPVYRKSGEIVVKNRIESEDKRYHTEAKNRIEDLKRYIMETYEVADKDTVTGDWLTTVIDRFNHPEKYQPKEEIKPTFFALFDNFLTVKKLSEVRKKNFRVIYRALQRFEMYQGEIIDIDTLTNTTLRDFEQFLKDEHTFFIKEDNKYIPAKKYIHIYKAYPETRTPQPRGQNTINDIFVKLRTFYLWAIDADKTTNNPFKNFKIEECVYGSPYYITLDERNTLYNLDLSDHPQLAIQRDIFVFQAVIGCRVGDLYSFTIENIIDGELCYVARKTKDGNPVTVKVPLSKTAIEILERYKDSNRKPLLPYISEQKYNVAIKRMLTLAGITRNVICRNPTTGETETRPINEIASSHMARRTFVGNLYSKVKDPNLVGKLSGHKEGSKAFSRYRDIDKNMREELINLID